MDKPKNKTMSVMTMGKLLGLKKVESYWLVNKGHFDVILVNGKMRVVTESFEHWYAGQVKYHKVNGDPPGERLRQESYSAKDIAGMLSISEAHAYEVMKAGGVKPVLVDYWQRYPKTAFYEWYAGQSRYRNEADRLRDAEIEETSISLPEMAKILDVHRNTVYSILNSRVGKEMLEVVTVADRKRVTLESFERWYCSQSLYLKPEDQPEGVPRPSCESTPAKKIPVSPEVEKEVRHSNNPVFLTVDEAAVMAETSTERVYRWIRADRFPVLRVSRNVTRIPKDEFETFLESRQKNERG